MFFTRRTIYILCIDMYLYGVAFEQATLFADYDSQVDHFMDEVVDKKILKWIRLVIARQPDAEFVFVATKADTVDANSRHSKAARSDLEKRLKQYVSQTSQELQEASKEAQTSNGTHRKSKETRGFTVEQLEKLQATIKHLLHHEWVSVSCVDAESIKAARTKIEEVVVASNCSFLMPESYVAALEFVRSVRSQSPSRDALSRVQSTFVNVNEFVKRLRDNRPDIDFDTYREILRTLHDLGDVLWYEDLGIERLKQEVILDPMLLIDFIRPFADHKFTSEVMTHDALKSKPLWLHLDRTFMLTVKQLLREFNLVHATRGEMQWDSDLLVPASWRSNIPSSLRFGGQLLSFEFTEMAKRVRPVSRKADRLAITANVQWEYHFLSLPESVFDQIVIASFSPFYDREVGPDWILYHKKGVFACRIVISRHRNTKERFIRVEAVAGVPREEQAELWALFKRLCLSLERVLRCFGGLTVSRHVLKNSSEMLNLDQVVDGWLETRMVVPWLPPTLDWYDEFRKGGAFVSSEGNLDISAKAPQQRKKTFGDAIDDNPYENYIVQQVTSMRTNREDNHLSTFEACGSGDLVLLQKLLDSGENMNSKDAQGNTLLHKACQYGIAEVARFLLNQGASVSLRNEAKQTPLCSLLSSRLLELHQDDLLEEVLECIQLLLEHGTKWDDVCEDSIRRVNGGNTARRFAVSVKTWVQSSTKGDRKMLPKLPSSIFKRGPRAITDFFVHTLQPSRDHFRLRIYLLGHDEEVKRELAATLLEPGELLNCASRVHLTNFNELNTTRRHDISVWNLPSGQNFDAVNSIFFADQTLFVVCLRSEVSSEPDPEGDINATHTQLEDAEAVRLVMLIHARHPDAAIVLCDVSSGSDERFENISCASKSVMKELDIVANQCVTSIDQEAAVFLNCHSQTDRRAAFWSTRVSTNSDDAQKIENARSSLVSFKTKFSSLVRKCVTTRVGQHVQDCTDTTTPSVGSIRSRILQQFTECARGIPMTETLEEIIQVIRHLREEASQYPAGLRIQKLFFSRRRLFESLRAKIPGLDQHIFDTKIRECLDLGELMQSDYVQCDNGNTEVKLAIDPGFLMLLIEGAFNGATGKGTLSQEELRSQPMWSELDDESVEIVVSMLENMRLAYRVNELSNSKYLLEFPTLSVPTLGETSPDGTVDNTGSFKLAREYEFVIEPPTLLLGHVLAATRNLRCHTPLLNDKQAVVGTTSSTQSEAGIRCDQVFVGIRKASSHDRYVLQLEVQASNPPRDSQRNHFSALHSSIQDVFDQYPGLFITWTPLGWLPVTWAYQENKSKDDRRRRRALVVDDSLSYTNVCVIGSRYWGRSSLIKSLITNNPSIQQPEQPELGLQVTSGYFIEGNSASIFAKRHVVNFSEFSGEPKYEEMHTLHYKQSMIFLICVDHGAYATARAQATILEDNDSSEGVRVDAFVARNIVRRVERVLDHKRDARFVFVATKADKISDTRASEVKKDFVKRLREYTRLHTRSIKTRQRQYSEGALNSVSPLLSNMLAYAQRLEIEVEAMESTNSDTWIRVSCADSQSVFDAQQKIESLIVKAQSSVSLPRRYSQVFEELKIKRQGLRSLTGSCRLTSSITSARQLRMEIQIPELNAAMFYDALTLLTDFGDLVLLGNLIDGDILDDRPSKDDAAKILLDIQLVVDLVRNLFDSQMNVEAISHHELVCLPLWSDVEDPNLLSAMKRLLQKFRLAHSIGSPMELNSHLVVPAFWKQAVGNHDINITPPAFRSTFHESNHYNVLWRYYVGWTLPDSFFEDLAIASYSTDWPRHVYRGLIKFIDRAGGSDRVACQVWIEREEPNGNNKGQYVVFVGATSNTRESQEVAWAAFKDVVKAMTRTRDENHPGLFASPIVMGGNGHDVPVDSVLRRGGDRDWMPPSLHEYNAILLTPASNPSQ